VIEGIGVGRLGDFVLSLNWSFVDSHVDNHVVTEAFAGAPARWAMPGVVATLKAQLLGRVAEWQTR